MHLPNKLAISLLVSCGMLICQVQAALPGAFHSNRSNDSSAQNLFGRGAHASSVLPYASCVRILILWSASARPNHPNAATIISTFAFDAAGNRALQTKERISANDSRKIERTLYLGSYERETHETKTDSLAPAVLEKTVHRHILGNGLIYTRTVGTTGPVVL